MADVIVPLPIATTINERFIDNGDGSYSKLASTTPHGTTGVDFSANAPSLPNVGANFGASGPYANYVLVKTIPANPFRVSVEVANLTGSSIAVIRDDGTAGSGAAPTHASIFALAGGAGPGQQGGGWTSSTFKGRLQLFTPAALTGSAFITTMED